MAEKKIVVAFDFDGTLISADSLFVTARHVLGTGKMLLALLRAMPAIVKWKNFSQISIKVCRWPNSTAPDVN